MDGTRVALVHDYLTQRGGAERVVLSLCRAFPDAPLYTSLYNRETTFPETAEFDVRPLWLDRVSPLREHHVAARPFLPFAIRTSSVDADVVVCSSSGWAHAIRTAGRKVVYCHSPAKWLYRRDDYLGDSSSNATRAGLAVLSPWLRRYDRRGAESADVYVANSTFIASQIQDVYGIDARVVHPPPGVTPGGPAQGVRGLEPGSFVLTVSRLLPYKNVATLAETFRKLTDHTLVIVGDGPERFRIVGSAPKNVRVLGEVDDETLRWLYANCAGLVAASREDFGLTPLEAAGFGKPTAALRWGGFLDTVTDGVNGVLFDGVSHDEIADAVRSLLDGEWDEDVIRAHAERFSEERFAEQMQEIVAGVR